MVKTVSEEDFNYQVATEQKSVAMFGSLWSNR
jgi:hypothetical protein